MTDLYDDELLTEYLEIIAGEERWAESMEEYSVKLLLVEPGSGLAKQIESNGQWEAAYQNEQAMVYVSRSP